MKIKDNDSFKLEDLKIFINGINVFEDILNSEDNSSKSPPENLDNSDLLKNWDFENDFIHENETKLLNKTQDELHNYASMAYVLNTAKGVYYMKTNDDNSFLSSMSLYLDNGKNDRKIFSDIVITGSLLNKSFMIVYDRTGGIEYLIDTTGFIYKLAQYKTGLLPQICGYKIKRNFKTSCFEISGSNVYVIPYMSKEDATENYEKTIPDSSLIINKRFLKFLNKRKTEDDRYLYFTLTNGKNGAICRYFCEKYGNYEILPNLFLDDETVNVRVKMPLEEVVNDDYYYICSKYEFSFKNFSIYNMPIKNYIGALDLYKYKLYEKGIYTLYPKPTVGKAPMYVSINETIKQLLNLEDDYELFKKIYFKLEKKIDYSFSLIDYKNNTFEMIRTEYPIIYDDEYIEKKLLYYESKEKYKETLKLYENNIYQIILDSGYYVPKWKSESDLYVLIKKYYDDAIFQYRTSWLGQQSIDVYIPSLMVGFEYQGEQHFKPIEFFGGEDALESNQKRDLKKKKLCDSNNVVLLYWNYDELVNAINLKKKLKDIGVQLK